MNEPGDLPGAVEHDDLEHDDREVSATPVRADGDFDAGLRPRSLADFIGQPRVCEQLELVLHGAKKRGGTPDHILLSGPRVWARRRWR